MGKLLRVCGATLQPYPGTEGVRCEHARSGAIGGFIAPNYLGDS